jgi:iron complex transport system permease protein
MTAAVGTVPARRAGGRVFRPLVLCGAMAVMTVATAGVSLTTGDYPLAVGEVLRSLLGLPSPADLIVHELRLPRVVTGVLAGAAFGLSGALFQSVIRNPLASPDLIGVSAGASVGAVAAITLGGVGAVLVPTLALLGGAVAAALVYGLAYRGGLELHRLVVVVGIALGGTGFAAGALTSLTSLLLLRAEITNAQQATVWLIGSLHGRTYDQALAPLLALAVALPLLPLAANVIRSLSLGDEVATALGTRVGHARVALLGLGVLLAAAATAAAGPVGFVALGTPQIARRLLRTPTEPLLASALLGAFVVTAADLVARRAFAPMELPVGIFTAAVGGPYLLWLLTRSQEPR